MIRCVLGVFLIILAKTRGVHRLCRQSYFGGRDHTVPKVCPVAVDENSIPVRHDPVFNSEARMRGPSVVAIDMETATCKQIRSKGGCVVGKA
ncbi:MAG: hypothetical protein JWL59_2767 [Chthoniobacteraceae bacterium]|nr:hypothetical protein [Chthoniobacteraceae bacterium]